MGRLIAWLFDAIIVFVIVRMVLRLVGGLGTQARSRGSRGTPAERAGGTLVRDPQCGTHIPQSRAIRVGTGDHATYFCSTDCRDAYQART